MSYREVYKCDICNDETPKDKIMGVRFMNMRDFRLDVPESTKGAHICIRCLDQLRVQLGPVRQPPPAIGSGKIDAAPDSGIMRYMPAEPAGLRGTSRGDPP